MTSAETRRFKFGVMFLAFTSAAAIVLSGWALWARSSTNSRVWHAVICRIETAVTKQHLPEAKERKALRFYDRLLTEYVQTDGCGLIEKGKP